MTDQIIVAFSTCPDEATAVSVSKVLVEERLAACVNRIAGIGSVYQWEGRLRDDPEVLLIIKTTAAHASALQRRLIKLHPYDLPELVILPVDGGNEPYLDWIRRSMGSRNVNQ